MTKAHLLTYKSEIEAMYQYAFYGHLGFSDFKALETKIQSRIQAIVQSLDTIDQIISKHLINYTVDRLNLVDLSIVRIAVYDLLNETLPAEVVINIAIELTKLYSNLDDEKQRKFNNKLLDTIYKGMK